MQIPIYMWHIISVNIIYSTHIHIFFSGGFCTIVVCINHSWQAGLWLRRTRVSIKNKLLFIYWVWSCCTDRSGPGNWVHKPPISRLSAHLHFSGNAGHLYVGISEDISCTRMWSTVTITKVCPHASRERSFKRTTIDTVSNFVFFFKFQLPVGI